MIAHVKQLDAKIGQQMSECCTDHSHYRIVTENLNRVCKLWGAVRGKSHTRMHQDKTHGHGTDSFKRELNVVWSLENMKVMGFFDDESPSAFQIY